MNNNPLDLIRQSVTDSEARIATALAEAREEGRREILREVKKVGEFANDDWNCVFCGFDISDMNQGKRHVPGCLWLRAQAVK